MASWKRVSWLWLAGGPNIHKWAAELGVLLQQLRAERLLLRRLCLDVGRAATAVRRFQASLSKLPQPLV